MRSKFTLGRLVASSKRKEVIVSVNLSNQGADTETMVFQIIQPGLGKEYFRRPSNRVLAQYYKTVWPSVRMLIEKAGIDKGRVIQIRREVLLDMTPRMPTLPGWLTNVYLDVRFLMIR